eukprot:gene3482-3976_t
MLPMFLVSLSLDNSIFNKPIERGVLPETLTHLDVGPSFNQRIIAGSLPESMVSLILGDSFCEPLAPSCLPSGLESLTIGNRYNEVIGLGVLPKSLTKLRLGSGFNSAINPGVLPQLIELSLGDLFNQRIAIAALPMSLKKLVFGRNYDIPIEDDCLPAGLEYLEFGYNFRQILRPLPTQLKFLAICDLFGQPLNRPGSLIPLTLTELVLHNYSHGHGLAPDIDLFLHAPSITRLTYSLFNGPLFEETFPHTLTYLSLHTFNKPLSMPNSFPPQLKHLQLGSYNSPISPGVFPATLTRLDLGPRFMKPLRPGTLPPNLQYLTLGRGYYDPLPADLPPSLTLVECGLVLSYQPDTTTLSPIVIPLLLRGVTVAESREYPDKPCVLLRLVDQQWVLFSTPANIQFIPFDKLSNSPHIVQYIYRGVF